MYVIVVRFIVMYVIVVCFIVEGREGGGWDLTIFRAQGT